jgi:sugar lactone lactonase YvrE
LVEEEVLSMDATMKGSSRTTSWWILLPALLGLVGFQASNRPESWDFTILYSNLPSVDNIAVAPNGDLFVSLESRGRVLRLSGTRKQTVAENLRRADGLLLTATHLFVTEEARHGRVLKIDLNDGSIETLLRLKKPEGIDQTPEGNLLVTEDARRGRVLRLTPDGRIIDALAVGLNRPEGIAVAPDGTAYVAETGAGRVVAITQTTKQVLVSGLNKPDQVAVAPDGSVWITEDAKPGRLLRYKDGQLTTVLEGLQAPQGIAFRNDEIIVAEQGRERILSVRRRARK